MKHALEISINKLKVNNLTKFQYNLLIFKFQENANVIDLIPNIEHNEK